MTLDTIIIEVVVIIVFKADGLNQVRSNYSLNINTESISIYEMSIFRLGGGNQSNDNFRNYGQNQHRNDNYYSSTGNANTGAGRGNYYGQNQGQDFNRKGDGYNRGQSNYNRGGRR